MRSATIVSNSPSLTRAGSHPAGFAALQWIGVGGGDTGVVACELSNVN